MTLKQALKFAHQELRALDRPSLEAELLLAYHPNKDRTFIHIYGNKNL